MSRTALRRVVWLALAGCGALAAGATATAANSAASSAVAPSPTTPAPAAAGQPAAWLAHDLLVKLDHLPKRYSCDDLWYRFHDLLLAIGARPDVKILAYGCEKSLGIDARSPEVHLNFYLPQVVAPAQAKWADMKVRTAQVEIKPGVGSWKAGDCALLRQIKGTFLPTIDAKVVDFRLACAARTNTTPPYELTVSTELPVKGANVAMASTR